MGDWIPFAPAERNARDSLEETQHVPRSPNLLNALRMPLVLVDPGRTIHMVNARARELLARADTLRAAAGRLACVDLDSDIALGRMMAAVSAQAVRHALRVRRRDGQHVPVVVAPLDESSAPSPRLLVAMPEQEGRIGCDARLIAASLGLTEAEARLAACLADGSSPADCARSLNVKIITVRSQLISIYSKTGARGQADLVRIVASLAVW